MNLLANKSAQTQYGKNIATLQDRATQIYNVMESLQTMSSSVGELATQAGNGAATPGTLTNYVSQLNGYLKDAVKLANTQDATTGSYLFGGTNQSQPPFTATTDADGNITGVTYNGNGSVNQSEIGSDTLVAVDVPGVNATGTGPRGLFGDAGSGANLFANLINLRDHIAANASATPATQNTAIITGADTAALKKDSDNLLFHISNNGVLQSRLNVADTQLTNQLGTLNTSISNQTSADMVQTIMQLNQAQSSYQAALQSGAKIMQLSILNYIS